MKSRIVICIGQYIVHVLKTSQRDQSIVDNNSVHAFKSNLKPVSVENSTLDSPTETNHTYHKEEIVRESVYEINFFLIASILIDQISKYKMSLHAVTTSMTIIILAKFYQTLNNDC